MNRAVVVGLVSVLAAATASVAGAKPRVLTVGTYRHIDGQYETIQAAVNAARPGDWILIGPGDYKTTASHAPRGRRNRPAGVLITKRNLHLRGMNRNKVIVDGTKPGSAPCSRKQSAQNFGPRINGKRQGLNGVMVWKANNVSVQNMTACNFLGGSGHAGNEFWWNGGDDSAKIGGWGYNGSYLSATSTFFKNEKSAAQYGIFSSNWNGGTWNQTYASNFNDSGYYIGACQQECNQVVNRAHGEFSALGYSGSNSGGSLVVKNSEFDQNQDGFDTNSQNGDNPPPQNGACPHNGISPITHTHSCWVFMHNTVHDNNNPHVPSAGSAAAGPVGTGMSISGGRNDTVMHNRFANNKAWGIILVPYLDSGPPCTGGSTKVIPGSCLYDEWGDALVNNKFSNNGGYGNKTNGDFDQLNFTTAPTDCYHGNTNPKGLSPDAASLQKKYPACTGKKVPPNLNIDFLNEVLCDSQVSLPPFGCQKGDSYPRRKFVAMHPLPKHLRTMHNPCAGVPRNAWCEPRGNIPSGKG
ncbi:MAG: hypothetical protein ACTHQQ_12035 [Solirubrobacteraceae bacterium]